MTPWPGRHDMKSPRSGRGREQDLDSCSDEAMVLPPAPSARHAGAAEQSTTMMPRFTGERYDGTEERQRPERPCGGGGQLPVATAKRRTCDLPGRRPSPRGCPEVLADTEFTPSAPPCTRREAREAGEHVDRDEAAATGTTTASTSESCGSRMTAIMRLPTATMGALARMRISPFTNAWTWVTSLRLPGE